jgi:Fe-S oxidoreductase
VPNRIDLEEPITLDDELWQRVTTVTGGATAACFQCGVCTASCPWGVVRGSPLNIRQLVRRTQLGLDGAGEDVWLCTGCRQCLALCPRGVDVPAVFRALREERWHDNDTPDALRSVLWSTHWDGNPLGQPPSQRAAWAADLALPRFDATAHELLLYIGCSASYDRRLQKVARALVQILRAAGVEFGVMGEDEPCCGESVLATGNAPYFEEIAARNSAQFAGAGVGAVVTVSPHCFDAFTQHREAGEQFRPLHYTQLLAELVEQGRIPLAPIEALAVTYHDPCYLGRAYGVYEEPRRVLQAVAGAELREMENNREQALCCGGGGGRMWLETPAQDRFAAVRAREAQATGATVIATACPACLSCLEDGLKISGASGMRVMDVAEIVAGALATVEAAPAAVALATQGAER